MEAPNTSPSAGGEIGSRMGVRFYRYRAVLKRYWWVLAVTVSLGLLYEAWVVFTKPTRYVSNGKLSVRETRASDSTSQYQIQDSAWYGTIIETLKSRAVLDRAKKLVAVQRPGQEGLADQVEIGAKNEVNTWFFTITGVGPHQEFTAFYVDRVMEAFMALRREESSAATDQERQNLNAQATAAQVKMETAQRAVDEYVKQENSPFVEQQAEQISDELSDLRKSRESLAGEIDAMQHMEDAKLLETPGSARRGPEPESASEQLSDKEQELAIKLRELEIRSQIWKPAHPRFRQLKDDIEKLNAAIESLKLRAEKGRAAVIASLKSRLAVKDRTIVEYEKKAKDFSTVLNRYKALQAEVDRHLKAYEHTRDSLEKLVTTSSAMEILAIHQPASAPVVENRGVVKGLLTGLIGGLLLGLGILFLLDRADDRLASSSEMIEQFNEPILGQIPDVADSRTQGGLPLLQEEDERYMYAEAFRSLRSSLIFMPNQTELKTLIITSAIPNEGKSTIASNLAITMANAGARVLLVDADLRRGDIAALFDTDGRQGLANILRGEVAWKDCVKTLKNEKLHIIPRGPVTNQSGELLLQPTLPKLLAEWKATYDLVIFNTAPILATDDTPTVAPNFDGTLMVIRASFTSARLTRNSLNALYQRQVNVLGLILNCVDTEMPDYYYYRYPKYYAA